MALTANRDLDHHIDQELGSFAVAATAHIYKGGFVGLSTTGYAQPLVAGDPFIGVAFEEIDNTSGADGDLSVRVYTLGDFGSAISGAAVADVGRPVFAAADDTLTFVGTANSFVGVVRDVPTAGQVILRIDPSGKSVKTVSHAVDNLAAGADIAERAIHSFDQDAWIVSARVVNQATASAGIDASNTCVLTLKSAAATVVTETFDNVTTFPAANAAKTLGAVANVHSAAGSVMTLAVTNGATADPGPFVVEVDYV